MQEIGSTMMPASVYEESLPSTAHGSGNVNSIIDVITVRVHLSLDLRMSHVVKKLTIGKTSVPNIYREESGCAPDCPERITSTDSTRNTRTATTNGRHTCALPT